MENRVGGNYVAAAVKASGFVCFAALFGRQALAEVFNAARVTGWNCPTPSFSSRHVVINLSTKLLGSHCKGRVGRCSCLYMLEDSYCRLFSMFVSTADDVRGSACMRVGVHMS
jgi:hypothetical protein